LKPTHGTGKRLPDVNVLKSLKNRRVEKGPTHQTDTKATRGKYETVSVVNL
jgi:hypothetical protein